MRYVPLDGRPWHHAMGLRPLEPSAWLELDDDGERQIGEKRLLISEHRDEVLVTTPDSEPACAELLTAIVENLAQFHPGASRDPVADEHPLVAASLLVPEDLCVLARDDHAWRLVAACVCFPSRWRLADKLGESLRGIHGPVPGYEDDLATPVDRFFDRLSDRAYWRLNWTLLDDATLFQPGPSRGEMSEDPADWVFRVERQTLCRLADSGAAVFTIRTHLARADELVRTHPGFAADVATVLSTAPASTRAYKGWVGLAGRWAAWAL
jgi:hypothetical protein